MSSDKSRSWFLVITLISRLMTSSPRTRLERAVEATTPEAAVEEEVAAEVVILHMFVQIFMIISGRGDSDRGARRDGGVSKRGGGDFGSFSRRV